MEKSVPVLGWVYLPIPSNSSFVLFHKEQHHSEHSTAIQVIYTEREREIHCYNLISLRRICSIFFQQHCNICSSRVTCYHQWRSLCQYITLIVIAWCALAHVWLEVKFMGCLSKLLHQLDSFACAWNSACRICDSSTWKEACWWQGVRQCHHFKIAILTKLGLASFLNSSSTISFSPNPVAITRAVCPSYTKKKTTIIWWMSILHTRKYTVSFINW